MLETQQIQFIIGILVIIINVYAISTKKSPYIFLAIIASIFLMLLTKLQI